MQKMCMDAEIMSLNGPANRLASGEERERSIVSERVRVEEAG